MASVHKQPVVPGPAARSCCTSTGGRAHRPRTSNMGGRWRVGEWVSEPRWLCLRLDTRLWSVRQPTRVGLLHNHGALACARVLPPNRVQLMADGAERGKA